MKNMVNGACERIDEEALLNFCKKYTYLFCYGTGLYAELAEEYLSDKGVFITAFCVSDAENTDKIFKSRKVYTVSNIPFEKEQCGFILSLDRKYYETVKNNLAGASFMDFFEVDEPFYDGCKKANFKKTLQKNIKITKEVKVMLGSGSKSYADWFTTDIRYLDITKSCDWEYLFEEGQIDYLLAEHVWEHLCPEDAMRAAKLCYQNLRKGGCLRVAVPDGNHPDPQYIDWVRPGGIGPGCEDHKIIYTYGTFTKIFEGVGFKVQLVEYFDEKGVFHQNEMLAERGHIDRSKEHDQQNSNGILNYTSIILDAIKIVD